MKSAVVTGITGQDGAYTAEMLLARGYRVFGTYRPGKAPDFWRLEELGLKTNPALALLELDITDLSACKRLIEGNGTDEFYNYGGQAISIESTNDPDTAARVNGLGPLTVLNAIRDLGVPTKFCQASSAEMFGVPTSSPQNEETTFVPRTYYGLAKLHAHRITESYRKDFGLFGCSSILFNHESPLRDPAFLTRKITHGIARLKLGLSGAVELGNLESQRDWGFARDYVEAMWRMLQAPKPDSYVLATGRTITVRRFAELAADAAGFSLQWKGTGTEETAVDAKTGKVLIGINPAFVRPPETAHMCGDNAKAKRALGWAPKTSIEDLCRMMVETDLRRLSAH